MTPPAKIELPKPGEEMELALLHKAKRKKPAEERENLLVRVYDEDEEGWIVGPPEGTGPVAVRPGEHLWGRFSRGGISYEFDTVVLATQGGRFPFLYLLKPEPKDVRRRQMRSYVRVDCEIPVQIVPHGEEGAAPAPVEGTIRNISGGGAAVSVQGKIPPESLVRLRFTLPGGEKALAGIIARVLKTMPEEGGGEKVIFQFEGIDEATRNEIIRYTFEVQRKAKRKGAS